MMRQGRVTFFNPEDQGYIPPDLGLSNRELCSGKIGNYVCCRRVGHDGDHAAHGAQWKRMKPIPPKEAATRGRMMPGECFSIVHDGKGNYYVIVADRFNEFIAWVEGEHYPESIPEFAHPILLGRIRFTEFFEVP